MSASDAPTRIGYVRKRLGNPGADLDWSDYPIELRLQARRFVMSKSLDPHDRSLTHIYCIGSGRGPVKIGRAKSPQARLKGMQTGTPDLLRLIVAVELPAGMEREIHRELAASRYRGEWFRQTQEVVAVMEVLHKWAAEAELARDPQSPTAPLEPSLAVSLGEKPVRTHPAGERP